MLVEEACLKQKLNPSKNLVILIHHRDSSLKEPIADFLLICELVTDLRTSKFRPIILRLGVFFKSYKHLGK